jgi:hypothetical protein
MSSASLDNAGSDSQNLKGVLSNCSILLLPFVLHLAFMTCTAFFVMHIQVSILFQSKICLLRDPADILLISSCYISYSVPLIIGVNSISFCQSSDFTHIEFPQPLFKKMELLDLCLFHCLHSSR